MSNKSNMESNIRIGQLLRDARESQHKSQADIARATGMSKNHISGIERGTSKASVDLLIEYCKVLSLSPNEVLGYGSPKIESSLLAMLETLSPEKQSKVKDLITIVENF